MTEFIIDLGGFLLTACLFWMLAMIANKHEQRIAALEQRLERRTIKPEDRTR